MISLRRMPPSGAARRGCQNTQFQRQTDLKPLVFSQGPSPKLICTVRIRWNWPWPPLCQPHRNGLRQAKSAPAKGQSANYRRPLASRRINLRPLLTRRMLELPQTCRLHCRLPHRTAPSQSSCHRRKSLLMLKDPGPDSRFSTFTPVASRQYYQNYSAT